mgnify:FL=1
MDGAVRGARLEDAERILEIYACYVRQTAVTFEYEVPTLEEFRSRMEHTMERYPYLVIEAGGAVQGYAYAGPLKERAAYDWSCETTIYLDRGARRRGMGRQLYEALEDALGRMGILNLYACVASPEGEDQYLTRDSEAFHRCMGYRTVGEFRFCGCKFGRWYHTVWMEKVIGERRPDQPPVVPYPASPGYEDRF